LLILDSVLRHSFSKYRIHDSDSWYIIDLPLLCDPWKLILFDSVKQAMTKKGFGDSYC
jgi:hypothetical protein